MAKLNAPDSPFAAIVLAKAGMVRLGWGSRITCDIPPPTILPAVGQGALVVEIREGDARARAMCAALSHWPTAWACGAERACLRVLEGGCSVPVGVSTTLADGTLTLTGCVTSLTGDRHVEHTLEERVATLEDAEAVGARLAKILIDTGARAILDEINEDRERRIGEAKTEEEKQKIEAAIAA